MQVLILELQAQDLGTPDSAEGATNTNPRLTSEPARMELPGCQLNSRLG